MPKIKERAYTRHTEQAAKLLGKLIRLGRKQHKFTAQDLADRAGISRGTLRRIENGDLNCEIGLVFEVASLVGVCLFELEKDNLTQAVAHTSDKLKLLPSRIQKPHIEVHDDF